MIDYIKIVKNMLRAGAAVRFHEDGRVEFIPKANK